MVIVMAIQGYLFIQRTILKLEEQFTIMQKIDVASFYLRQDIQAAGYRGARSCDNTLLDLSHIKNKQSFFSTAQTIFTKTIIPMVYIRELPPKIEKKLMQQKLKYNTDVLFIKDIPKAVSILDATIQDPCAALQLHNSLEIKEGDLVAIADAKSIERFVASRVIADKYIYHQLPENNSSCLYKTYNKGTEVIAFQYVAYYLAKTHLNDTTYTLYRDDLTNKAEGIIDGVEDFYIKLLTAKSDGNRHNMASGIDECGVELTGVEIGLLLRSDDKFFKSEEILWRGVLHKFKDGFLRKPFIFKVALRNVC